MTKNELIQWWVTASNAEKDAMVAEMVMGWQKESDLTGFPVAFKGKVSWVDSQGCHIAFVEKWHSTTTWATFGQVVERMEQEGWGHRHLKHSAEAASSGVCHWEFMKPGKGFFVADSNMLMDAGCLAACLAVLSTNGG